MIARQMRVTRRWPILIGAWLLIGQRWPGVEAWENLEPMESIVARPMVRRALGIVRA